MTDDTVENIRWHDNAREYARTYGLTVDDVEAIVRMKNRPEIDPRSTEVGHLIVRYHAGDVFVVVGYREPHLPVVMAVMVNDHHTGKAGSRTPGGVGKTGPTTIKELTKRVIAQGYRIEMGGSHLRVLDKDTGEYLMSLPSTPSDYRSVPNAWALFLRKKAEADRQRKEAS